MDAENYDENIHVTFKIQDADYATFYHTTLTPSGLSDDEIVEFAFGRNEASEDNEWFYIPSDWEGVGEHYLAKIMSKTSEAESFGADTTPTFIKWFEESEGPHCWTCGKENPQGHFEGVDNICEPCHSKWIYDEGGPEGEGYYLVSTLNEEQRKFFKMDAEEGNAPIQDPMEFGEMANWTPLDGSEGLKRKRAESPSATIPANEPSWVKPVATALGFALGFFGIHEIKKVL